MIKCPQCKTSLPIPEAESTNTSGSHSSRPTRSVQPPAASIPPLNLTDPSDRPAPASKFSLSAHHSKQNHPVSRTGPEASDSQQNPTSIPPIASTQASMSNIRQPLTELSHSSRTRSGKSSTAGTSEQITTTSPLDLQLYKKPRSRYQGELWIRAADNMLEEVPSGPFWREKMTRIESSIMAAVAIDIPPTRQGHVPSIARDERDKLIRLVRNYAERHSEWRINFQQFILVCLCNVLSYQGVSRSSIVETLQICISETTQQTIEGYLRGATWVNKLMSDLFLTDWGYRAVDLIAICKVSEEPRRILH